MHDEHCVLAGLQADRRLVDVVNDADVGVLASEEAAFGLVDEALLGSGVSGEVREGGTSVQRGGRA